MPRNSSGTYTLPEPLFISGTPILATPMNSDLTDIANALTDSLPRSGGTMSGQVQAASGTVSAPGIAFVSSTNTGFYLSGVGEMSWAASGALAATFNSDGTVEWFESASFAEDVDIAGELSVVDIAITGNATIDGRDIDAFPSGTRMFFSQTSAPTGWTKITDSIDGRAIRLVSGEAGGGGSLSFTACFADRNTEDHTLLESQIPLHGHPFRLTGAGEDNSDSAGGMFIGDDAGRLNFSAFTGTPTDTAGQQIGGTGGGGSHSHRYNTQVLYSDAIACVKD